MKRWWPLVPALVLVALSVVWPALALVPGFAPLVASGRADAPINAPSVFLGTWPLLGSSLLWAFVPALVATIIAWPLGHALAERWVAGRGRVLLILSALPLCLPGYLVYWSLWSAVGPDSAIGEVAIRANLVPELRQCTLVLGLIAWSAPFAAWTIAAWRIASPDGAAKLRVVDGATLTQRIRAAARHDAPALVRGTAVAMLALMAESVSYDLAQVRTYGYELRTLDATGGSPRDVIALGWPGVMAVLAVVAVATLSGARRARAVASPLKPRRWPFALAGVLALPAMLVLGRAVSPHEARTFLHLYGGATMASLALAITSGALLAMAAASLVSAWNDRSRVARGIALLWLVAAATPATIVAVALESAWNRDATAWIYESPMIVVLGLVARFGAVSVIAASLAWSSESLSTRRLRALDAPRSWRWRWRVRRPTLVAAALVAAAAGAALSFSEIAVTARVRPPSVDVLATSTLNAIHYQMRETVILASAAAVTFGAIAAVIVVLVLRWPRRALVVAALLVVGCRPVTPTEGTDAVPPVPLIAVFGTAGFGPGQFNTPRAVAYAANTKRFFVIDKAARVQRFDADGKYELEWKMPESKNGNPVGISIHPDGRVFIADTHYYRVMIYDQDGHELARFGSYGKELGEFIYPTDIAFGNDGRIYVGEFGSNDRISVFSSDFKPLKQIGSMGVNDGELSRPQTLVIDADRNELIVADGNNHRIVIYDAEGNRLRQFGTAGHAPGELCYPRGIVLLGDGTILVGEFGNHRVQRFVARPGDDFGKSLGIWGGAGTELGRLQYPWDLAGIPGRIAIVDSGHNRLLLSTLPAAAQESK